MRPGLVMVGAAFLVVGSVALASLYLTPNPTIRVEHDSTTALEVNPSIWATTTELWGENGTSPTFTVRWQSTVPVQIVLLSGTVTTCASSSPCVACPCTVAHWAGGMSGIWTANGTPAYPYELQALSTISASGLLNVVAAGAADMGVPQYTVQKVASSLAAIIAVAVGGIALFLGLFLRANPYGSPPPVIPLRPEDIEELYGPDSESDDDEEPGQVPPRGS